MTPRKGEWLTLGAETILPTYVRLSESPKANGACNTANYADPDSFTPAGYYVEFVYVEGGENYRRFISFAELGIDR